MYKGLHRRLQLMFPKFFTETVISRTSNRTSFVDSGVRTLSPPMPPWWTWRPVSFLYAVGWLNSGPCCPLKSQPTLPRNIRPPSSDWRVIGMRQAASSKRRSTLNGLHCLLCQTIPTAVKIPIPGSHDIEQHDYELHGRGSEHGLS
jgi:hypothetical protein